MGIASRQELPSAPRVETNWTARTLVSLKGLGSAITKTFQSPLEWFFAFCLLVIASAELADRQISWFFYCIAIILLFAILIQRAFSGMTPEEPVKK